MQTLRSSKISSVAAKANSRVFRRPPCNTLDGKQVLQSPEMPPTLFQGRERSRSESEATQMTRTTCTHFCNIKRMCQPFNCTSYTKTFYRATNSTAVTWCGQEFKPLSQQLESDNNRQVGSGLCARVSNSPHQPAKSGTLAKPSFIPRQAKLPDSSGDEHAIRERGNYLSEKPFRPQEFLLNSVPCFQEGRPGEASYQPQEAERMGGTPALQNGWYGDTQGTNESEQLDSEGRPQRSILHNPNTHRPPTLPEIHSETGTLSVHMPPIRPVICPISIH